VKEGPPPRARASPAHRAALEAWGLGPALAATLGDYLDLLALWDRRLNLTGARSVAERARLLVGQVVPAARWLEAGSLIDVGSGNGSPGLVLAVVRPELDATLLEPRQRRWAFLREAARTVGRPDIRILRQRHDAYHGPPARNLTLRGLRLDLRQLRALVQPGGQVLSLGRSVRRAEGFSLERSLRLRGGLPLQVFRRTAAESPAGPGVSRET
jgi:16S rRNA (guanine527-N7)-methyltransferase